jgi:hypothetical protein
MTFDDKAILDAETALGTIVILIDLPRFARHKIQVALALWTVRRRIRCYARADWLGRVVLEF